MSHASFDHAYDAWVG
jgi:hypothetical protein